MESVSIPTLRLRSAFESCCPALWSPTIFCQLLPSWKFRIFLIRPSSGSGPLLESRCPTLLKTFVSPPARWPSGTTNYLVFKESFNIKLLTNIYTIFKKKKLFFLNFKKYFFREAGTEGGIWRYKKFCYLCRKKKGCCKKLRLYPKNLEQVMLFRERL